MHVGYSPGMSERRIDRDAWAKVVRGFVDAASRGNKSAFARRVGMTTKTIDRWLASSVDVSEQSVRVVAEALDQNPMDLLVLLGYYRPDEMALAPPTRVDASQDPVVRAILDNPQLKDSERNALVRREVDRIEQDRARRLADFEFFLQQREARGTA